MIDSSQVVVGVGNPIMGDDGIGHRVVRQLQQMPVDARIYFAGTTAFLALEVMSGADRAIIVDAINVPEANPGSIHRFPLHSSQLRKSAPDVLMHDFSVDKALVAGRGAYDLPPEVILVGVVPAELDMGVSLSPAVEAQIDCLLEEIQKELRRPLPS